MVHHKLAGYTDGSDFIHNKLFTLTNGVCD